MTTEREALERALDLFNGKAYGKNASDETIAAMDADAPAFWAAHKATILALAGVAA